MRFILITDQFSQRSVLACKDENCLKQKKAADSGSGAELQVKIDTVAIH
jgi:hypothetical protein